MLSLFCNNLQHSYNIVIYFSLGAYSEVVFFFLYTRFITDGCEKSFRRLTFTAKLYNLIITMDNRCYVIFLCKHMYFINHAVKYYREVNITLRFEWKYIVIRLSN